MKDFASQLTQTLRIGMMLSLAAALLLVAHPAGAQTSSAAISGHVVDQSQGVVPNASIRLIQQSTNVAISTQTNANGDFVFTNVQPGTYSVIVTAQGYKELRKVNLVLSASQNLSAGTFVLAVGAESQSVTVEADITPLQTSSSERSGVLDTQQIDNLLSLGRDVMAMTKVIPGVVENTDGYSSLSQSSIPVTNGVNSEYDEATVDGVVSNTRGNNSLDTPLNLDAVQEVTVNASNYQAQYGGTAGANFNFVTKGGTNRYHGALYEYFRNTDLNANAWFNKFGAHIGRPTYRYNTLGGTLGGPLFWPGKFNRHRDKLFFFVSVDYEPIKQPDGLKYYTVPTLAQTQGDFSQTYNQGTAIQTPATLINIKNPNATGACPVNGTPGPACFTGNQISSTFINTPGQILLQTIYNNTLKLNPSYAFTDLAVSDNNYNYVTNYSASKPVNQEVFRIDYAPTEKLHVFFRGELANVNDNDYSSPANDLPWLMKVNYKNSQPNFGFNAIYTFTPTLVNELNVGTAGWSENQLYANSDLAKVTQSSSGLTLPTLYPGVNPLNLFPAASFGGVTNAATYNFDYRFPMLDQVRSYNATDNLTKVIGNHTLKFGVDGDKDYYLQTAHNRVPSLAFAHDTSNPYDSNFAYSNALLGNLDTYTGYTSMATYAPGIRDVEWYYQDTWRVRPNLTLDYGMRNAYAMEETIPAGDNFVPSLFNAANAPTLYQYTASGTAENPITGQTYPKAYAGLYVPGTGNTSNGILYAKTHGYPEGDVYSNGLVWAPRFGFAWSLDPKTVLRGGFGIFYNVRMRSGQQGDFTLNAPVTNTVTQYYSSLNSAASNYYLNAGTLSGPYSVSHAIDIHQKLPYAEEGSLGIQREFPFGMVLDVAYVGTFTKHASDYTPINEVPYGAEFLPSSQNPAGGILPDNFFRPYAGLSSINMQYFNLTANYNALQVRVTRRFHNGLEFGGAYTYSRAMDYTDSYNGTVARYESLRKWNYGPAGWDLKHMLVLNYLWGLPHGSRVFGDNSPWNNIVTRQVLDNWQISGFATYYSGAPGSFTLSLSNGQNVTGGGDGARPVLTCDPWRKIPHVTRTFHEWFNSGCVEAPLVSASAPVTASSPNAWLGSGNLSPKVNYFLPGDTNFETALVKNMPIENKVKLQLRVETYNTFNHPEFNGVNAAATFANANAQGSANPQTGATFGQLTSAQNPRYVQLALRLDF